MSQKTISAQQIKGFRKSEIQDNFLKLSRNTKSRAEIRDSPRTDNPTCFSLQSFI